MDRSPKLSFEDVAVMYISLYYPKVAENYLKARENSILHTVCEINPILSKTCGELIFLEQYYEICFVVGLTKRQAKILRFGRYGQVEGQEIVGELFIEGVCNLGYSHEAAEYLLNFLLSRAYMTFKEQHVINSVKKFILNESGKYKRGFHRNPA